MNIANIINIVHIIIINSFLLIEIRLATQLKDFLSKILSQRLSERLSHTLSINNNFPENAHIAHSGLYPFLRTEQQARSASDFSLCFIVNRLSEQWDYRRCDSRDSSVTPMLFCHEMVSSGLRQTSKMRKRFLPSALAW